MTTEEKEMLRLKELDKIDGTIGAKKVGMIVDLYNKNIDKKREKDYNNDVTDRNLYYYKLWQRAIEEIRFGMKPREKSKPHISLPPDTSGGGILLSNGEKYTKNKDKKNAKQKSFRKVS